MLSCRDIMSLALLLTCHAALAYLQSPIAAAQERASLAIIRQTHTRQCCSMTLTSRREAIGTELQSSRTLAAADFTADATEQQMMDTWQFKALDSLFSVPLINALMFGIFRSQMVAKAEGMGIPWRKFLADLSCRLPELQDMQAALTEPTTVIPQYYYSPIHAYDDGNLCWDSALEEDLWSKLMIAPLFNNRVDGDVLMRQAWLDLCFRHTGSEGVRRIIDLGCGTGLSMYMAHAMWPQAEMLGVDLSTYKLAIAEDKRREQTKDMSERVRLVHRPAEATREPDASQDLAMICLVNRESPLSVSKAMFAEAYRLLRPGGHLTILDLDKHNLENLLSSAFVAAIYKQTEPYMGDYLKLDITASLRDAGFTLLEVKNSSRSHVALIAVKPG